MSVDSAVSLLVHASRVSPPLRSAVAEVEGRITYLERALYDLLDTLERGDGFKVQERLATAGRLLGLPRYMHSSDGFVCHSEAETTAQSDGDR